MTPRWGVQHSESSWGGSHLSEHRIDQGVGRPTERPSFLGGAEVADVSQHDHRLEPERFEMVTFIKCFTVSDGCEDRFLELWAPVNAHMVRKPEYVDHAFHRSVDAAAPFRFVNIAHWESSDAWRAAHDVDFRAMVSAPEWREFPSVPVLYDAVPVLQGGAH